MTTRTLHGSYAAGYTLSSKYSTVALTSSAFVGGSGLVASAAATVQNHGSINSSSSSGITLDDGGAVTNYASIKGIRGINAYEFTVITNTGSISGALGDGVRLVEGGSVFNSGVISGTIANYAAIKAKDAFVYVENSGQILDSQGLGIDLLADGVIKNGSSTSNLATVKGNVGVYLNGVVHGFTYKPTIMNYGTIVGTGGTAIELNFGQLIVEPGSYIKGVVEGPNAGLELAGNSRQTSGTISGLGTQFVQFGGVEVDANASWTLVGANTFSGGAVTAYGTLTNAGALTLTSQFGSIRVASGGVFINGNAATPTAVTSTQMGVYGLYRGASTVINYGSIEGTGGIGVQFASSRDRLIAEAGSTIGGAVEGGGGTLELASGAGTITGLGGAASVSGDISMTMSGFGAYVLDAGSSWTLTGSNTVSGDGALSLSGTLENAGALAGGMTLTASAARLIADAGSAITGVVLGGGGTLELAAGTGTITGLGGAASISGGLAMTFSGFGTYQLDGGGAWSLSGSNALSAGEIFALSSGTSLTLTPGAGLSLGGAATLAGLIDGAGSLSVADATVSGLTVGGSVVFTDAGSVTQTGEVAIGDATKTAANLLVAQGAAWTLFGAAGIVRGASTKSRLNVLGALVVNAAGEVDTIDVDITDGGLIEAAAGELDLGQKLAGSGSLQIDAGATLKISSAASAGLTVTFAGDAATLALKNPKKFAATIAGLASGDIMDLLGKAATSVILNASDQLVVAEHAKTVATLQLAGNYAGDTFTLQSDGAGGTEILVTSPNAAPPPRSGHALITAMASLGAKAAWVGAPPMHAEAWSPRLLAHRTQCA